MLCFVDANIFIRFFTGDDREQFEKARALFQDASEGKIKLLTGPPVLFETAWTLRSRYDVPPNEVINILEAIAAFPGIRMTDERVVMEAISLARRSSSEFADAYIAASAVLNGAESVATFNKKHFKKLGCPIYEGV